MSLLSPCPHGMSTHARRHFVVYRKPEYGTRFWLTHDGRGFVGTTTLGELAQELRARGAQRLYALPLQGRPADGVDLTDAEAQKLLTWLELAR